MSMYEALKEYFESVGGVVAGAFGGSVHYDFPNGAPDIDEVAEKFGLVIDEDGDGLFLGDSFLVHYLDDTIVVMDN